MYSTFLSIHETVISFIFLFFFYTGVVTRKIDNHPVK